MGGAGGKEKGARGTILTDSELEERRKLAFLALATLPHVPERRPSLQPHVPTRRGKPMEIFTGCSFALPPPKERWEAEERTSWLCASPRQRKGTACVHAEARWKASPLGGTRAQQAVANV